MAVQRIQWSPTDVRPSLPMGLPSPSPLAVPSTKAQAREAGETAVSFGLALIVFGLILQALAANR